MNSAINIATQHNKNSAYSANGDRTVLSGNGVGSGVNFLNPHHVELDAANNRAFVYDIGVTGIIVVELSTGERAVFSK